MTSEPAIPVASSFPAPEVYVGHLLRRAQQVHSAGWNRFVSKELSSVQFAALSVLARSPGASQAVLGKSLDLDRSTIADVVRRMEANGLLTRVRSTDDSRRYVLHLTDHGSSVLTELSPRVQGLSSSLTSGLSEHDTAALHRILVAFLRSAGEQGLLAGVSTD